MSAPRMSSSPVVAERPAPAEPRSYGFPRFERHALGNGVRIVVARVPKLPLVSVAAVVDAGAMVDPPGQEGLAVLTARALAEGAAGRTGAEITDAAEGLGTALESGADWDAAVVRLTVLAPRLGAAMSLLGDVLLRPTFPDREIERLKAERLADLLQIRAEPRGLADEMVERFLYAPEARYVTPEGGNDQSVAGLTPHDVTRFYRARYQPSALTLIVVGDVTVEGALALAQQVFGKWTAASGATSPSRMVDQRPTHRPAVHLVSRADAPQSELRVTHVGVPRSTSDYFPITVLNAILGGLFSSRINLNLREAHAYTYGAHSAFDWRRGAGPFVVSTAVQSGVTDAAIREVVNEIARIRETEVTEAELSLATSYLDGVFPIRYETTAAIASALAHLVIYDLPGDYFDRYRAQVRGVTAAHVLQAAKTYLHPEQMQVVVVGDPTSVRAPLDLLGYGPVTVYDDTGELVR